MQGHAQKCVERYCKLANKTASSLQQVVTSCIDDHLLPPEDFESKGERSGMCVCVLKYYSGASVRKELDDQIGCGQSTLWQGQSPSGIKLAPKDCSG